MPDTRKGPKRPLNTPGRSGKQKLYNGRTAVVAAKRHVRRLRSHGHRHWMADLPLPRQGGRK